jgi:anthraniloyl-CoA monooxygenase
VFETDPETFERAGLDQMSEAESAKLMERIFGWFLQGHPVLTNRSLWRNFPMIRNKRWVLGNKVLLGDAKATAHFSIGSGTKLAMEDAIALYEAFRKDPTVEGALTLYETGRREEVEKTQHAADVSLVWFEHVARFWDFDPVQFSFGVMTRAKAITYDNLRLRAPDFVDQVDRVFARKVREQGFDVDVERPVVPMFQPLRLRDMVVPNRVVMSPMDMYSAVDGVPGDWHLMHYGSRATGGAGLIFTEMTCPSPEARITLGLHGAVERRAGSAWRRHRGFRPRELRTPSSASSSDIPAARAPPSSCGRASTGPLESGAWEICSASPFPISTTARCRGRHPAPTWTGEGGRSSLPPSAATGPASICSNSTAPTAICWRASSRRSQPAHGRIWRLARKPPALPARGVRGHAGGLAGA